VHQTVKKTAARRCNFSGNADGYNAIDVLAFRSLLKYSSRNVRIVLRTARSD
jgi:hypothetical protein